VLVTASLLEGGDLAETHDYYFLRVDLLTISNTPFLTDMRHGLQFARAGGHEREVINVQ